MTDGVTVIGAGGHAKVVISTLIARGVSIGAVFDDDDAKWGTDAQGTRVSEIERGRGGRALIAIGDNAQRREFAQALSFAWETVVHPSASVHPSAKIGRGTVIFAGAVVQPDAVIGDHVIVNTGATIDHDCVIGDYAHLAPGVHLAGAVQVGEGAFLGIGSSVLPGVKIGRWSTLGAGGLARRDLPEGVIAVGVPARFLKDAPVPGREPTGGGRLAVIGSADREGWMSALRLSFQHDVYHLPAYHALAESRGEGAARLFAYTEGEYAVALPLLLRPLHGIPGLAASGWQDATSVYGYPGPVFSHSEMPPAVLRRFHAALDERLAAERVVAVFSRLHPLIPQPAVLAGAGDCVLQGQTVPIDLTPPLEQVRAQYRRNHRRDLKALAQLGVTCVRDDARVHLDAFIAIYMEAMRRVQAEGTYHFDRAYFEGLLAAWDGAVHLFVCLLDGRPISAGLFTDFGGIAQAHLAGTLDEFTDIAPMKVLYDEAVAWAKERGCRVLHIGGGIGSKRDSLFAFKSGFSPRTADFLTWQRVLDAEGYAELCAQRAQWNGQRGLQCVATDYFPAYRAPAVPLGAQDETPTLNS